MTVVLCAALAGCGAKGRGPSSGPAEGPPPPDHQPQASVKPKPAAADIRRHRHSVLLDFDRATDAVFIAAGADAPAAHVHDGRLLIAPGARQIDVKLSSLLSGRAFPADWTLIGGHFRSDRDVPVDLLYSVDGNPVLQKRQMLPRGRSTPVLLDLTPLSQAPGLSASQTALLSVGPAASATIELDDLLLVDNRKSLAPDGAEWAVEQVGHSLVIDEPMKFRIVLPTDASQKPAWDVAEITATRLIAHQNYPPRRWVIYADGRSYEDGKLKIVGPKSEFDALYERQHATPAQVLIPEDHGELLRQTKGDVNNDGYNELLGAYQIEAKGARLDITLEPKTAALVKPVLEIHGLPQGKLVTTLEGRLIETADRHPDGRVLLTLPHKILRPATLNVRVQ